MNHYIDNLKKDGVGIEIESRGGDSKIIITTRNRKTVLGANDLGVWGESQEQISKEYINDSDSSGPIRFTIKRFFTAPDQFISSIVERVRGWFLFAYAEYFRSTFTLLLYDRKIKE